MIKKRFKNKWNWMFVIIALLLNILVYVISSEKKYTEEMILTSIVLFSFYQFSAVVFKKQYFWAYIIVFIGVLLISVSQCIGLGTFFMYDSPFSYGYALSILNSNSQEVLSMLSTMISWVLIFLLNICFQYFVIFRSKDLIVKKAVKLGISILWLLIPLGSLVHSIISNRAVENRLSIVLRNSPIYNFRPIAQAYHEYAEMKEIRDYKTDYAKLDVGTESIPTVVLVIGESSRRQNMSLYGYERNTTPFQLAEKDNMLLYTNMVSPASITLFSVPMLLSGLSPADYQVNKSRLGDNVIQLANYLKYNTYWFSTQEEGNMYVSTVSNLAKFSKSSKWFLGFDEVLVDQLAAIVKSKEEKKFIVLHINGSHSNACDKYPSKANYYVGGNSVIDCYDNSIRYTDSVLHEIFKLLKNENAAVIYLSDHAEKMDKDRFFHSDSKEGTEVPYYVWYGNQVPVSQRKIAVVSDLNSLISNYSHIAKLFGVKNDFKPKDSTIQYLKSDMSVIEYKNLAP